MARINEAEVRDSNLPYTVEEWEEFRGLLAAQVFPKAAESAQRLASSDVLCGAPVVRLDFFVHFESDEKGEISAHVTANESEFNSGVDFFARAAEGSRGRGEDGEEGHALQTRSLREEIARAWLQKQRTMAQDL